MAFVGSAAKLACKCPVITDEDCFASVAHHHGANAFAFAFTGLLIGVSVDLVHLVKVSSLWWLSVWASLATVCDLTPRCALLRDAGVAGGTVVQVVDLRGWLGGGG